MKEQVSQLITPEIDSFQTGQRSKCAVFDCSNEVIGEIKVLKTRKSYERSDSETIYLIQSESKNVQPTQSFKKSAIESHFRVVVKVQLSQCSKE